MDNGNDKVSPETLVQLLDLTSLNENDSVESIHEFCGYAENPLGKVAAVCVYPQFVNLAHSILKKSAVPIATVINFPWGNQPLELCYQEIKTAINSGAREIDAVIPYQLFLAGNQNIIKEYVQGYKDACGKDILLKVILETGAYSNTEQIAEVCFESIVGGADFIKTSTGKIAQGATLEVALTVLNIIKSYQSKFNSDQSNKTPMTASAIDTKHRPLGLKISGGVSSIQQAEAYYRLVAEVMGIHWISRSTLRMGSSRLLKLLLQS